MRAHLPPTRLLSGLLGLALVAGGLGGCAATRPGRPNAGPPALYSEGGFQILRSRWIHAGDLEKRELEAVKRMRAMGAPEHVITRAVQELRPTMKLDLLVDRHLQAQHFSYLLLEVRLDPKTEVLIRGPGALIVSVTSAEGEVSEVPDRGLLLCPGEYPDQYLDTARSAVTFHHGFDGTPDYKRYWHLFYVRLPHGNADGAVRSIRADPALLVCQERARK